MPLTFGDVIFALFSGASAHLFVSVHAYHCFPFLIQLSALKEIPVIHTVGLPSLRPQSGEVPLFLPSSQTRITDVCKVEILTVERLEHLF